MSLPAASPAVAAPAPAASNAPSSSTWSTAAGKPQLSYADRLRMAKEAKQSGNGNGSTTGSANGNSSGPSIAGSNGTSAAGPSQQQQPPTEAASKNNDHKTATTPSLSQLPPKPQPEESMAQKMTVQAEHNTAAASTSSETTASTAPATTTTVTTSATDLSTSTTSAPAASAPAPASASASTPPAKPAPSTQPPVNIWELRKKQMAEAAAAKEKEREQQRLAAAAAAAAANPTPAATSVSSSAGPSTTASQVASPSTSLDSTAQPLSKAKKKQQRALAKAAAAAAAAAGSQSQPQQQQQQQHRPSSRQHRHDEPNTTMIVPSVDSKTMAAAKNQQQRSNASSVDSRLEAIRNKNNSKEQQDIKPESNIAPAPSIVNRNTPSSSSSKAASQQPSAQGSPRQQHPFRQRHQLPPNPSRVSSPMKRPASSSSVAKHTPAPSADNVDAWTHKINLLNGGQNIPDMDDTAKAKVDIAPTDQQVDDSHPSISGWDDEPSASTSSRPNGEQHGGGGESSVSHNAAEYNSNNYHYNHNKGHLDGYRGSPSGSRPKKGSFYSMPYSADGTPSTQMANLYLGSPASRTSALDGDEGSASYHNYNQQYYDSPGGSARNSKSRNNSPAQSSRNYNNDRNQARQTHGSRNGTDDQQPTGRDESNPPAQHQQQQMPYQQQQHSHPQYNNLMMMGVGPMHAYGMAGMPPAAGFIVPSDGTYPPEGSVIAAHPAIATAAAPVSDGSFAPVRIIESHSYGSNQDGYSPGAQMVGLPLVTPYPHWQTGHSHEQGRRPPRTPVRKRGGAGQGSSGRGRGNGNQYNNYNRRYDYNRHGSGFSRHDGGDNGSQQGQYDASLSPSAVPSRSLSPSHASESAGAMTSFSANNGEGSTSSAAPTGASAAHVWPYAAAVPLVTDGYHWYPVDPAFVHHLPAGQQLFDPSQQGFLPQQHPPYPAYAAFPPGGVDASGNVTPLRYAPLIPMPTMMPINQAGYPVDPLARSTNSPASPISRLVGQIEFYFSDENLATDLFLRQQMDTLGGWVPLSLIASFKRLAKLCAELQIDFDTPGVKERLRVHPDVEMDMEGKRIRKRFKWEQWVMVDGDARGANRSIMEPLPAFSFNVGSPEVMATTPTMSPPSSLQYGSGSYGTQQSPFTPPQHGSSEQHFSSPSPQEASPSHHQQQRRLSRNNASPPQFSVQHNTPMVPLASYPQSHPQHQVPHQAHPYHLQLYPGHPNQQPLMLPPEASGPGSDHGRRGSSSSPATAQESGSEQQDWRHHQDQHHHRMSMSPSSAPISGQSMEHHHSGGSPADEMSRASAVSGPLVHPAFYAAPHVGTTHGAFLASPTHHGPHYVQSENAPYYPQRDDATHHMHRNMPGSGDAMRDPSGMAVLAHHHPQQESDAATSRVSGDGQPYFDGSNTTGGSINSQVSRQNDDRTGARGGTVDLDSQQYHRRFGTAGSSSSSSLLPSPSKQRLPSSGTSSTVNSRQSFGYAHHSLSSSSAGAHLSDTLPTPPGSSSASAAASVTHSRQSTADSARDMAAGGLAHSSLHAPKNAHDDATEDDEEDEEAGLGIVAAEGLGLGGLIGSDPASRG